MQLKVMSATLVRRLLAGEQDVLTPLAEQRRFDITTKPCPRCGGAIHQYLDPQHAFSPENPLPRSVGRCVDCGYTYDAASGIVLNNGNPAKVEEALPLIKPKDD